MEIFTELPLLTILVRVGTAVIVLLVGHRLARLGRNWVKLALTQTGLTESLVSLFTLLVYYLILLLTAILALTLLGVQLGSIIVAIGIVVIILGIALQESLANFAATILFLLFQPYKVGELIETSGVLGKVKEIQLFYSVIVTAQNKVVTIPNSKVQDSNIINYSRLGVLRADVDLSVSYKDDLAKVKRLLQEMMVADERVLEEPAPFVAITNFGDNGIEIGLRPFVQVADYWNVQYDFHERIKEIFDAQGITIPFPQRDVHMATVNK